MANYVTLTEDTRTIDDWREGVQSPWSTAKRWARDHGLARVLDGDMLVTFTLNKNGRIHREHMPNATILRDCLA